MRHKLYERVGRFVVRKDDLDALPDWLQQMMSRVIVLRSQYALECDGNEYVALCPQFQASGVGMAMPTYTPLVEDGRFLRFEYGNWTFPC
jgi:hypothetical protein